MESLLISSPSWLIHQSKSTRWTKEENKLFESALAMIDERNPDRWFKVADMIPGKSVYDVLNQYKELVADVSNIEAGLVPIPGYLASPFALQLVDDRGFEVHRKRGRSCDHERKKGVPWTEEEHRRFLMGLQKYGKGDWRNISRNFVISKTPTQVASHAQKYFLRQHSGGKDKRRPSIHDITTVNVSDANLVASDTKRSLLDEKSQDVPVLVSRSASVPEMLGWNFPDDGALMASVFSSPQGSQFVSYPSEIAYAKLGFQIPPTRYQIRG
nr:transcription factor DIVARICATA-like [Ipomoea batatas]